MKFYIVDAFTDELFGGNPAGIVFLDTDFPRDEIMRKTAAELRYSETAFIKQLSDKEFNIRYFTPAEEVDLCGHATIASFVAMQEEKLVSSNGNYVLHSKAGILEIEIKDGFVMMEMGEATLSNEISDDEALKELYEIMGIDVHRRPSLIPQMASTGLMDIMMPVEDEKALNDISPDFRALSELSRKYEVVGVHAFCLAVEDERKEGITAHCRNFAPLYEIDEEAATGTSNGALTHYLFEHDIITDDSTCLFIQGEAMNRPSKIRSHISNGKIMVGGGAVILASGEINI